MMLLCLRLRLIFSHCRVFHVDISVGQAGLMVSLMKYVYLINTALYQSLTLGDLSEGLITELLSSEVDSPAASCVSDILEVSVLSRTGS